MGTRIYRLRNDVGDVVMMCASSCAQHHVRNIIATSTSLNNTSGSEQLY